MPNLKHNGRWVLDTAESVVAAGIPVRITAAHYIGTSDVDDCILHDGNGKLICSFKLGTVATTGYQASLNFGEGGQIVDGLDLDTIDHGTLIVYLGKL
jgi:hypothetical protein